MNINDKISSFITLEDDEQKENIIEEIGDIFEYGDGEKGEVIECVNILLSQLILEKKPSLRETILHTINNAVVFKDVGDRISLDILIPHSSTFEVEELSYVLSFLGFSGQDKYKPLLQSYLDHSNSELREAALEALEELNYRSSN